MNMSQPSMSHSSTPSFARKLAVVVSLSLFALVVTLAYGYLLRSPVGAESLFYQEQSSVPMPQEYSSAVQADALDTSSVAEPKPLHSASAVGPAGAGTAPHEKTISDGTPARTEYFPAGYVNRGRDDDGNVMTYEHD
jgi:hypothetical protein